MLIFLCVLLLILAPAIWGFLYYVYFSLSGQVKSRPTAPEDILDAPPAPSTNQAPRPFSFRALLGQFLLFLIIGAVVLFLGLIALGGVMNIAR